MKFTFTSLPLNVYTSVSGYGCGFGFEQKYWQIDGFGEKKARIGGFAYPTPGRSPDNRCVRGPFAKDALFKVLSRLRKGNVRVL